MPSEDIQGHRLGDRVDFPSRERKIPGLWGDRTQGKVAVFCCTGSGTKQKGVWKTLSPPLITIWEHSTHDQGGAVPVS